MLDETPVDGINILNEKPLHAALKQWYANPDDRLEVRVDGFIIDLVRGDLLVEIQTGGFSPLKRKLARLVERHPVRLVFPVAKEKWIVRLPKNEQEKTQRRKSPRRGQVEMLFKQLIYLPTLMEHENFSLEVLLIREEEVRRYEEKKAWRRSRRGWVTQERRLLDVVESQIFQTPSDLARLIPTHLESPFTLREFMKAAGQPEWLARKMIYCFRKMGILSPCGKRSRAILYTRQ